MSFTIRIIAFCIPVVPMTGILTNAYYTQQWRGLTMTELSNTGGSCYGETPGCNIINLPLVCAKSPCEDNDPDVSVDDYKCPKGQQGLTESTPFNRCTSGYGPKTYPFEDQEPKVEKSCYKVNNCGAGCDLDSAGDSFCKAGSGAGTAPISEEVRPCKNIPEGNCK